MEIDVDIGVDIGVDISVGMDLDISVGIDVTMAKTSAGYRVNTYLVLGTLTYILECLL